MENDPQQSNSSSEKNNTNCSTKCNVSSTSTTNPSIGRYCHIVKRPDFDGYGFNLHSEKIKPGQYIGKVDPDSPAELAGLREGDQIIEVNGVNIGSETHKQVVQRIKAISNEVRLLLIDPNLVATKTTTTTTTTTTNTSESTNSSPQLSAEEEEEATTTTPVAGHGEVATSISMVSTKTLSQVDVTDSDANEEKNNNRLTTISTTTTTTTTAAATITNGKTSENSSSSDMTTHSMSQHSTGDLTSSPPQAKPALNLNLTAAEMRAKLLAKKKFDPKNESVDLKKKFDIIQKL